MDQAYKENIHHFMVGLEFVMIGFAVLFFVIYFVIRSRSKKKKLQESEK